MSSPLIVLTASSTEASEWNHSIWQQMLSATIPQKYSKQFINQASLENESWPDGRAKYVPNGLRMVETLLLREYPEGLTPREMQARLGVDRSLVDVCQGMLRYGLLRRVGRGRYVAV